MSLVSRKICLVSAFWHDPEENADQYEAVNNRLSKIKVVFQNTIFTVFASRNRKYETASPP